MTALTWDESGDKVFQTGISKGVLYPLNPSTSAYDAGFAWNGLTEVDEKPSGASSNKQYADNIQYLNLLSAETFALTIKAYTYPDEFGACDGTVEPQPGVSVGQQGRQTFGLCYRTEIGNDVDSALGYKLHLVYGCLAAPSEKDYTTINDSPGAVEFSWDVDSTPVAVTGYKPTSMIVVDSTVVSSDDLASLETLLYGGSSATAQLPLPDAVLAVFAS
jgi:hypothetical protein